MKHIILLCDGMADRPVEALGGKTPMEAAQKPTMDGLAPKSEVGLVQTVQAGMKPGSDVANLSVLGYDAHAYYTGRSPLEAANIGIDLADDDVALRCNLVTLSETENYADKVIEDYCADDISTAEADEIIKTLQENFGGGEFDFYTGTNYRHCLVWHGGRDDIGDLTPPHDITGQVIGTHLNESAAAAPLLALMQKSVALLAAHPINIARREKGLRPANAIWLWGQGKRPQLPDFTEKTGLKGAMVSAVDLLKGIARIAHMRVCEVDGATGYIDTNYEGKLQAALSALEDGCDLVYIHLEGPDECGHRGEADNKVKAIGDIDQYILRPLLDEVAKMGDFDLLVLPDHPTPLCVRTHVADAVPYLLYRSYAEKTDGPAGFSEKTAAATGVKVDVGYTLIDRLINR